MGMCVLFPGSNSNPSNKYRVVDFRDWCDHPEHPDQTRVVQEYDDYRSARNYVDESNYLEEREASNYDRDKEHPHPE